MINLHSKKTIFCHGNHKIQHISVGYSSKRLFAFSFRIIQLEAHLLDGTDMYGGPSLPIKKINK